MVIMHVVDGSSSLMARYVDFDLAQDAASKMRNTEQYITNQLFHNGISVDPKDVMKRLFKLSKRLRD
jgi:hypothetical protein